MTKLVLLPGLDGTGTLFEPLLSALPRDIDTSIVAYPTHRPLSHHELVEFILGHLPSAPFALLAESFSGPVSIAVAARRAPAALILACSFASNPRPALALLQPMLAVMPSPTRLLGPLGWLLMGSRQTARLREALSQALTAVDPAVLRHRAAQTLSADARAELAQLRCPVLYLQATQDRLVPPSCAEEVLRIQPACRVVKLLGPHFLLQTQPAAAAEAIAQFLHGSESVV